MPEQANAALPRVVRFERRDDGVILHVFDRADRLAGHVTDPCRAAVRGLPVHEHDAGTALLDAAAELRAREPQLVAKHEDERCIVRRADVDVAAVHPHRQAASGGLETARRSIAG